ncbi:Predicted methyltransferase [Alteromonadaceae bacterium Bs31]|nr:Predicted methyltransferase [Alteromonadaceae bacterium Bs31]
MRYTQLPGSSSLRPALLSSALATVLVIAGCSGGTKQSQEPEIDLLPLVSAAVNDNTRPENQLARDEARKPAEVLVFSEIKPGDRVMDIAAGGGYYTQIISRLVGEKGKVFAVNPSLVAEKYPQAIAPLEAALEAGEMPNAVHQLVPSFSQDLPQNIDVAINVLFYHDFIWAEKDREAVNSALFDALKPGGIYLVIDHASAEQGWQAAETLHRGNEQLTKQEILAAGFEFIAFSDVLRHPEDPLTENVFSEIRGKTDRFILKFKKPE